MKGLLGLCTLVTFFNFLIRLSLPPVLPLIEQDLGLSHAISGLALGLLAVVYAGTHVPGGWLADRFGHVRVILPTLGLMALGSLLLGVGPGLWGLLSALFVLGVGSGMQFPVGVSLLARHFVERRGWALGVNMVGASLAGAIGAVLAPWFAQVFGWQAMFALLAFPLIVVGVPFARLVPEPQPVPTPSPKSSKGSKAASAYPKRALAVAVLATGALMIANQGTNAFLPTYLVEVKGYDLSKAGTVFGLLFLAGIVAQPLCGSLADRWGKRPMGALLLGLTGLALLGLTQAQADAWVVLTVIGLGLAMRGYLPVIQAYLMGILPPGGRGRGFGLVRAIYFSLGSVGPVAVGFVAEHAGFDAAFIGVALLVSSAALGFYLLGASRR